MSDCGIIFDMDELLVDATGIWLTAEKALFSAMGQEYSHEVAMTYQGQNVRDLCATLQARFKPPLPFEHYHAVMDDTLRAEYAVGEITAMPGAVELVRRLRGLAPMAVASGSPEEGIRRATRRVGIADCLDVVISSESVLRGKPAPDVFLKAAELLGASSERCLVFEDSVAGVQAGLSAGMQVFAVPSHASYREQIARMATRTFASLREVGAADVAEALGLRPGR